ncbi:MAG TPA: AI-2E family transporter [Spirochaetia bacterium]|nr:AI-2E family transporter [Spirochaetia bacterium]
MNYARVITGLLIVITAIAVGAVLKLTVNIMLPLVIALLLSFVLSPLVEWLVRMRVPRILAIILVILLFLGFGFLLGLVLYSSVHSMIRIWPSYQRRFLNIMDTTIKSLNISAPLVDRFNLSRSLSSIAVTFFGNFIGFLAGLIMVLVYLLFILLEKPFLRKKLHDAIQGPRTEKVYKILGHINKQVGRYLTIKFIVSLVTGLLVWGAFALIGLDFAFIWGVLAFLFNFVPSIGSIAVGVVSLVFAVVQFYPDWNPVIAVGLSMLAIQNVIGNFTEPKLQGDNLNLSPVIILFSLLLWGWLWGVMGMFLSVPLTVALKIILEHIPGLEFAGVLMGTGNYRARIRQTKEETEPNGTQENINR